MDIIAKHRLHFDSSTRTGSIFHLMGSLSEFGKLGLTSISNSKEEASQIYQQVEQVLDSETENNLKNRSSLLFSSLPIDFHHNSL